MAKLRGGLFGRPSGQLQNLVIGAARDRQGKVATVREKTDPTNPNTPLQQGQRGKFHDCLQIVRDIGPTEYQGWWNRAIGQLPGFQSLMSILLNAMDATFVLDAPPDVPLGTLHMPLTTNFGTGGASGECDVTWSSELGSNGTALDTISIFAIRADRDSNGRHPVVDASATATRSTGTKTITGLTAGETYLIWFYLVGVGTALGEVTPVQFGTALAET